MAALVNIQRLNENMAALRQTNPNSETSKTRATSIVLSSASLNYLLFLHMMTLRGSHTNSLWEHVIKQRLQVLVTQKLRHHQLTFASCDSIGSEKSYTWKYCRHTHMIDSLRALALEVWYRPEGGQDPRYALAVAFHVVFQTCGRTADQRGTAATVLNPARVSGS